MTQKPHKLLAFDTSTEALSIAVSSTEGGQTRVWEHSGAGGAQASLHLIAAVMDLMRRAQIELRSLDAICFGSGPGSFTGLRTACAVAQGLAFGASVPVLPVNSLLAVAEDARLRHNPDAARATVMALLDARMDEMYAATFAFEGGLWRELQSAALCKPEAAALPQGDSVGPAMAAGNAFAAYGERLTGLPADMPRMTAAPTASAMLRLAPQLLAAGLAVAPEHALPLYIRDKVAQTTAERAALKAQLQAPTP